MTTFPRDRWVCVEMHVFIDPIAGVYEAYLDAALALSSGMMDTTTANGTTAAFRAIEHNQSDECTRCS